MSENKLSPMMLHYKQLKEDYPDTILLYRLGDFYEMFFDDAVTASKLLDLTLTGRDCGLQERAPMCGVPHHAVDNYISRLISSGNKVAICEQLSQPGDQKGMVKRDVIRVITPGTVIEEDMLDNKSNNYLAAAFSAKNAFAVAWLDVSTGEFFVREFEEGKDALDVEDFLLTLTPKEIIGNAEMADYSRDFASVKTSKLVKVSQYYDYAFDYDNARLTLLKQMNAFDLFALGLDNKKNAVSAAGGLLDYIINTQKRSLSHINAIKYLKNSDSMYIDFNTKRNLELFETLADKKKYGSLIWVIDKTKTSMGARQLKSWLSAPLQSLDEIHKRQEAVQELVKNTAFRELLGNTLAGVRDIERIVTKISYFSVLPRDCIALKESIKQLPKIKKLLEKSTAAQHHIIYEKIELLDDLLSTIERAICDEPPMTLKDGGVIKRGYSIELDTLRSLQHSAKRLLSEFELKQRELTGISTLKVGYNRVFGYYIEIPKSKSNGTIPFEYRRKQTVMSGERYTCEELEKLQEDIVGASDKALKLESDLFGEFRDFMSSYILKLQKNAFLLSYLDCLYSLAESAVEYNYVRPEVTSGNTVKIVDGRHPVVERLLGSNEFVPNDTLLDQKDNTMMVITGPNMAGKSTYIRQVALIVLLAHIGSFVPAKQAEICLTDRIFTRVGASDNLVQGQSTFMVEMLEVANIINNATSKSLLILDEIGRGTSTLDGLSIAWAIVEYILLKIKAKTLFATHYHELSEIESLLSGIRNYRILVHENQNSISFIYKISRGSANKSYGIEVAALAGIKQDITIRARDIMNVLAETHQLSGNLQEKLSANPTETSVTAGQMGFFEEDPSLVEIRNILTDLNINRINPLEALTILNDLKKIITKRKK
ncbi:MAG: DNA mismatch repair protein MutS [Clostridia bacterium]|nr:DNA mismatch repair protein MutS [Clostridia bacterium]